MAASYKYNPVIKLWLGDEYNLPDRPNLKDIDGYNLPASKQKFQATKLIPEWSAKYLAQKAIEYGTRKEPNETWYLEHATKEMAEFAEREWERRMNGYWFYNNGEIVYITGVHYYYLCWYNMGFTTRYRSADAKWFYAWDTIRRNPYSLGMIIPKHRRAGHTGKAAAAGMELISRSANAHGGFVSKEGTSAASAFAEIFVNPLNRQPAFFQPLRSGTTQSKDGIYFRMPARSANLSNLAKIAEDEYLDSDFTWRRTDENAYDQAKLMFLLCDEAGKNKEMDILKFWRVHQQCLKLEGEDRIRFGGSGKAILPTSVEDLRGEPGKRFKELWDMSQPDTRDEDGMTISGLTPYFNPCTDGWVSKKREFYDDYGNSLESEAIEAWEAELRTFTKRGDWEGEQEFRRQNPRVPEDCFQGMANANIFDIRRLKDTLAELESRDRAGKPVWMNYAAQGDLSWVRESIHPYVKFTHSKTGKHFINLKPINEYGSNNVTFLREDVYGVKHYAPRETGKGVIGVDPIDTGNQETTSRGLSCMAALAYWKFDPNIDGKKPDHMSGIEDYARGWETESFVSLYIARPEIVEHGYEEIIKLAHFFGWPMEVEKNRALLVNYIRRHGYEKFIEEGIGIRGMNMKTRHDVQKTGGGGYTVAETHDTGTMLIKDWIPVHLYAHSCPFPQLIEQWLAFNFTNIGNLDLYAASEFALIGANKLRYRMKKAIEKKSIFTIPTQRIDGIW